MEYESTQFFSDIGGAAGLILGVSLNAFFGIAGDFQIANQDLRWFDRLTNIIRELDGLVIGQNENEMDATVRIQHKCEVFAADFRVFFPLENSKQL